MNHSYKSIDEVLSGRVRLAIMSFLITAGCSDFSELLKVTEATKGNLGAQIRTLEEAGYVIARRSKVGRRSHMVVEISDQGRKALLAHIERLQELLKAIPDEK